MLFCKLIYHIFRSAPALRLHAFKHLSDFVVKSLSAVLLNHDRKNKATTEWVIKKHSTMWSFPQLDLVSEIEVQEICKHPQCGKPQHPLD